MLVFIFLMNWIYRVFEHKRHSHFASWSCSGIVSSRDVILIKLSSDINHWKYIKTDPPSLCRHIIIYILWAKLIFQSKGIYSFTQCYQLLPLPPHRQYWEDHEESPPRERQDRQGRQINSAGVRVRIYFLHYKRSLLKMQNLEEKNNKRRRSARIHWCAGLRRVWKSAQALPKKIPISGKERAGGG